MDLHIYIDDNDLDESRLNEIIASVSESISGWSEHKVYAQLLKSSAADGALKFGMSLQIKSKYKLKDPLNFLYGIAKDQKCEFVIATVQLETNECEDVCYFGYEEGRPDLFEVANYLDL